MSGVDVINLDQYKIILKNVYTSKEDNSKQLEMLRVLRESLNISEDTHHKMEEEIKNEINNNQPPSPEPIEPKENIMGDDMHLMIQEPPAPSVEKEMVESALAEPLIPPPPGPPTTSQKLINFKFKKNFTLGKEKYRKKDYNGALKYFEQCLELEPENEEIKFFIKKTNLKLKSEKPKPSPPPAQEKSIKPPTPTPPSGPPLTAIPLEDSSIHSPNAPIARVAIPLSDSEKKDTELTPPDTKPANVNKDALCVSCEGSGKCYWCNGTSKCDRCNGSGLFNNEPCTICGGSGSCNSCSGTGSCPWCKGTGTKEISRVALKI